VSSPLTPFPRASPTAKRAVLVGEASTAAPSILISRCSRPCVTRQDADAVVRSSHAGTSLGREGVSQRDHGRGGDLGERLDSARRRAGGRVGARSSGCSDSAPAAPETACRTRVRDPVRVECSKGVVARSICAPQPAKHDRLRFRSPRGGSAQTAPRPTHQPRRFSGRCVGQAVRRRRRGR